MVKAIQELEIKNEELRIKNENLEKRIATAESTISEIGNLKTEVETLKLMNEKIVKLEKILNDLTSDKQTSLKFTEVNIIKSK